MRCFFLMSLFLATTCFSQDATKEYTALTKKADAFFLKSDFKNALQLYMQAINGNNGLGKVVHRYKAASCFSILKNSDSAFFHLDKIVNKGGFSEVDLLTNDDNFKNLFDDPRWVDIVNRATINRQRINDSKQHSQ